MEDADVRVLLSILFDGDWNDQGEWLDHYPIVGETGAEVLAGALLLKAIQGVVKKEWGRAATRTNNWIL